MSRQVSFNSFLRNLHNSFSKQISRLIFRLNCSRWNFQLSISPRKSDFISLELSVSETEK